MILKCPCCGEVLGIVHPIDQPGIINRICETCNPPQPERAVVGLPYNGVQAIKRRFDKCE